MEGVSTSAPLARAENLLARTHTEIPLTAAMDVQVASYDGRTLVLRVPLAPNINDKGTAFAGSISALGSITGWCLLTLWSAEAVGACQVAIYDAGFRFTQPLTGDFTATVTLPDDAVLAALADNLRHKGRGRAALHITLADNTGEAATLDASYALRRT